jgi:hypothetical protein
LKIKTAHPFFEVSSIIFFEMVDYFIAILSQPSTIAFTADENFGRLEGKWTFA